jgi:hypothetical protein
MEIKFFDIFWKDKLIAKVIDYDDGVLSDAVRDMNVEISVKEIVPNIEQPARCSRCGWTDIMWNGEFHMQTGELECPVPHCNGFLYYGQVE